MNGSNSYTERQSVANRGEKLFEEYCKSKQIFCKKIGFEEKNSDIPNYYKLNPYLRNIPDYIVVTKTRTFLVMVKGTANMKKKEVDMIPQFIEWYGSKEVSLYYAFCFHDRNKPAFRTPDQVIELYQGATDKQWSDGVIYRTLAL